MTSPKPKRRSGKSLAQRLKAAYPDMTPDQFREMVSLAEQDPNAAWLEAAGAPLVGPNSTRAGRARADEPEDGNEIEGELEYELGGDSDGEEPEE